MFAGSASRTAAYAALFVLLGVCASEFATPLSAQDAPAAALRRETLVSAHRVERLGGVSLDGEWKFRLGDNPSWSLPTFDDSGWATLVPGAPLPDSLIARIDSLRTAGRPAVGWLRVRLMPERALLRKPLALGYEPKGASVVYLDGRKILELGDFSAASDAYADARAPLLPGAIVFDGTPAVLAIRYHLGSWDALQGMRMEEPLFNASVLPREAIELTAERRRFEAGVMLGLFGLFAALGLLHLVLHALMRKPPSTLHYSMFALLFSICPVLVYVTDGTESLRMVALLDRVFSVTMTFAMLALLTFLYTFFQGRRPRYYWVAVVASILLALALLTPETELIAAITVFASVAIEGTRVIWLALRRGTPGARVVGAGFVTTFALLLYGVASTQMPLPAPQNLAWYAWLGIALASAIQIAQSFASASKASEQLSAELALTNRSLESKVQERTAELEARAENERRSSLEQKALLDTMSELSGQLELEALLQSVLDRAGTLLGAACGELAIFHEDAQELEVVANRNVPVRSVGARMKVGEGAMGQVVAQREPLVLRDYAEWQGRSEQYGTLSIHALVVAPLLIGSRAVGAISVWQDSPNSEFASGDVRLLTSFAQQAAIAIQTARLYTEMQKQRQYFEAVVHNSPIAIITLDLEHNISACNPAFERLYGWQQSEILGRNLDELIADEASRAQARDYTARAESGTVQHLIGRRRRKDGSYVDVEVAAVPVFVDGERTGLLALYHDVTELLRARKEAEAADQAKSQFLANMSHELRTPLNAIIGYSEMMIEEAEDAGDTVYAPDLRKIHSSGRHLLGLINDILDLSKIEAGRMELYVESFALQPVLEEIATTVHTLVERNGNRLELEIEPGIGVMRSDQVKVRQILFNLLSNACKFTENGTITLRARRTGDFIEFTVSDTGIGMTADQRDRLFQPFMQADASTTKKYGGTGLGLAITKHFCEMMGGAVDLSSDAGKGTTFVVRILAEVVQPEPAEVQRPDLPQAHNAATVLVIDDDPSTRDVISRTLAKDGYRVVVASGGEEGLRLARVERPDVITLDVLMAGMDGWAVLTQLKADPLTADIPVIVMTIVDDRNLGFALGAADYLTKPVDRERLTDVLQRVRADGRHGPVLVVEDDAGTREMLRRILEKDNWRVVEAENGRVALDRMLDSTPALVLLDLMMPEMDGFTFVEELRTRGVASTVPIVVLTAKTLSARDRGRLEGSVSRVLQKGADSMAEVAAEVRRVVAARPAAPAGGA